MVKKEDLPSLEELDRSIKEAKERASGPKEKKHSGRTGDAMRVSVELAAGVIVGSFIGYWIDKWLGTLPVFFLICFCLGVAGSALNIYRMTKVNDEDEVDKT